VAFSVLACPRESLDLQGGRKRVCAFPYDLFHRAWLDICVKTGIVGASDSSNLLFRRPGIVRANFQRAIGTQLCAWASTNTELEKSNKSPTVVGH
jgi:Fe-S-cluster-containing dehydrogenase component